MITWTSRTGRGRRDVDPFSALEVQVALARVERLVSDLQGDNRRFAQAHHLYAAVAAYARLLIEACALAGVELAEGDGETRRLLAEVELRARGWSW
jgi:hypothetical protein